MKIIGINYDFDDGLLFRDRIYNNAVAMSFIPQVSFSAYVFIFKGEFLTENGMLACLKKKQHCLICSGRKFVINDLTINLFEVNRDKAIEINVTGRLFLKEYKEVCLWN